MSCSLKFDFKFDIGELKRHGPTLDYRKFLHDATAIRDGEIEDIILALMVTGTPIYDIAMAWHHDGRTIIKVRDVPMYEIRHTLIVGGRHWPSNWNR